MTSQDLNKLKVEITQDILRNHISNLILMQERVMNLNKLHKEALAKKEEDRTAQDLKLINEHEANLSAFTDAIEDYEYHISNFLSIIESYSNYKPVKL